MKEDTKTNLSDQDKFISNLIKMTGEKEKEFKKFVDDNLIPMKSKTNSIEVINDNINALRNMDSNQQLLVKARAKHFEEINDPSKYFPSLIAFIVALVPICTLLNNIANKDDNLVKILILVAVVLLLVLIGLIFGSYTHITKKRSTAVYFNSLVNNIEYNNPEQAKEEL